MEFKQYLLNENKALLAQKIGDVLNAIQELSGNSSGMGARELMRSAEPIVNQIRRILHSNWSKEDLVYLPPLQKVGVAIMRAIEEKDDLKQILAAAADVLQGVTAKTGEPINTLGGESPPNQPAAPMAPTAGLEQPPAAPQGQQPPPNQPAA